MDFTITFLQLFFWSIYLIAPLLLILVALIVFLGQIVTYLENWDKFDGLYWSFITGTTVGYGDIRPLKKTSKILSIFIAIIGMMFTGIVIASTIKAVTISLEKHVDPALVEQIKTNIVDE